MGKNSLDRSDIALKKFMEWAYFRSTSCNKLSLNMHYTISKILKLRLCTTTLLPWYLLTVKFFKVRISNISHSIIPLPCFKKV